MNAISNQYIANWHDSFVGYIDILLGVVSVLMARPEASKEDIKAIDGIKLILMGSDAQDVERDLAAGIVKSSTLDKIERLNKDLADTCLEQIQINPLVREFWRQMAYIKIERDKQGEKAYLYALHIPVIEG